jgi:lysophospholipase L1-like esterase
MVRLSPTSRRACASITLAASSILAGLGLVEAAFRVRAWVVEPPALGTTPLGTVPPGGAARLGHIVRLSTNRRIVYELLPNLDVVFLGVPLRTDAHGFRGTPVAMSRERPAARIVGLGDSVMFGWGVREEDTYLARLAGRLEAAHPGLSVEVVNTAVPGYNTVIEVETLEAKALRFDPDVVLLNFVGNDLGLPNFLQEPPDLLDVRRSFLFDFMRSRLGGGSEPAGWRLVGLDAEARRFRDGADLSRVPAAYRDMAGPDAWRKAMERLRTLQAARGFDVVVLAHPDAFELVRRTAAELEFPLVETGAAVREWARAHGIEDPRRPPLTITDADPHPTALGNEIIAGVLADHFEASGLAARLVARYRPEAEKGPPPTPGGHLKSNQ